MHLTVANLAHFLLSRGLLNGNSVVAGDLMILDCSRRNRNFKVFSGSGPGLFVKQMRELQTDAMLTLRREATCYELAGEDPALSRLMPRLVSYDANRHILILELLGDAESLAERHARERIFPTQIGRMLGEALGLYHAQARQILENEPMRALFARQVPVVLSFERGGPVSYLGLYGRIGPALVELLEQHPEFQTLLSTLGKEWRFDSLIHGDLKWDNVLVFPASSGGLDFRIVDWEMADLGDADWDVGAVLQSFLTAWVLSMPIASGLPAERYVGLATQPIESMRPVLSAFWHAYAATRGYSDSRYKPALERALRFGAARLVWAAVEQRLYAAQLDPVARALLQVSLNILKNPAQAMADLLDG